MSFKNLLIIFVRNPELGKVKTRLAKNLGDETALNIYKLLLQKTNEVTKEIACDKLVCYSEEIIKNDIWNDTIFAKNIQKGSHLGEKMQNAFEDGFIKGYKKIVIIGSDLYDLKPKHIEEAFEKLNKYKVVIGPAIDGGYYLLGLKKVYKNIFINKAWGTSSVRKDTLKNLENVSVHLLEELNDIDVFEDIKNHPSFSHFISNL